MKLLYISSPAFADCDFPLIRAFQQKGIDVTYLILLPCFMLRSTLVDIKKQIPRTGIFPATEYPEFKKYENYMDMSRVFVSNRTNKKMYSWSYNKENILLWRFIVKGNYDIVHCDLFFSGIRRLYYRLNSHWITTFHDPFPHTGEESGNERIEYVQTIKSSDGYVLLNEHQKQRFCEEYHVDYKKILVNSLGLYDNIRAFVPSEAKTVANNVLFFGRISPYKGVEFLCDAMTKVKEIVPDATLTIAGGGNIYFDIEPYKKLGYIEVRNHYIGMKELAKLLSRCELCVCPYTDATQSGVIMTSFSLAKPIVATDVGGLSEMVDNEKSGLLVSPRNSQALADAIVLLLKDKKKIQSMKEYIINHYNQGERSWDSIVEKYLHYYNNILND